MKRGFLRVLYLHHAGQRMDDERRAPVRQQASLLRRGTGRLRRDHDLFERKAGESNERIYLS